MITMTSRAPDRRLGSHRKQRVDQARQFSFGRGLLLPRLASLQVGRLVVAVLIRSAIGARSGCHSCEITPLIWVPEGCAGPEGNLQMYSLPRERSPLQAVQTSRSRLSLLNPRRSSSQRWAAGL
jgi:hypothetical protein